eukprot:TRINITY_DN11498_c0_g1_i10.p1 TRINITY_DN11498_c0_g1~~TRINITY_DN11498_c0_g1_i10.p1  ORF type:complete len:406 (-),score=125.77 TRINITY_DN11498_c0_g1_i10:96-1313(-)
MEPAAEQAPEMDPQAQIDLLKRELEDLRQLNARTDSTIAQQKATIDELERQSSQDNVQERKKWKDSLRILFDKHAGAHGCMNIDEFAMALGKKARNGKVTPLDKNMAIQVFRACDKNNDNEVDKNEFVRAISTLNAGTMDERAGIFFEILDSDHNKSVSKEEFLQFLKHNMKHNRVKQDEAISDEDIEMVVDAMFGGKESLGEQEFISTMCDEHSEVISSLNFGGLAKIPSEKGPDDTKDPGRWSKFWRDLVNNRKRIFLGLIISGLCAWAFAYKWKEYDSGAKFELMGYTLPLAKGCADVMKVTLIFVMLFMCRHFITSWRSTWIGKYLIEFDDAVLIHKITAEVFFVAMWGHVIAHVINVENMINPDNYEEWRTAYPDEGTEQWDRWHVYTCLLYTSPSPRDS